ncbi:MAG TPA: hypothetical protein VF363_07605 [Candidatus Eisenbacteria bacterium]
MRALAVALAAALIALLALTSCGGKKKAPTAPGLPSRSYVMGFSGFPPRPSVSTILQTIDLWSQRADAALILNEVPWDSLLAGRPADSLIRNDQVGLAAYYRAKGLRVVVSVDPTNGLDRSSDSAPLVAASRSLTEPSIQALYRGYVTAMDTLIHPDYLGLASETNLIRAIAPGALYDAVVTAANGAAADVHAVDPSAKLFTTVQVEVAWGRLVSGGAYVGIAQDRSDFPFIQALGLSSYPYLGGFADPDSVPIDYYDRLDDSDPIPMLVIEGGWSSVTVSSTATTPETQRRYIDRHAAILDRAGAAGWFQITFTDLDLAALGFPPGVEPFAHLGLVDTTFAAKPALSSWDAIFARPRR